MATQEGAARTFDLSLVTPEGAGVRGRGRDAHRSRRVRRDRRARPPRAARGHAQGGRDPGEVAGRVAGLRGRARATSRCSRTGRSSSSTTPCAPRRSTSSEARREAEEARALLAADRRRRGGARPLAGRAAPPPRREQARRRRPRLAGLAPATPSACPPEGTIPQWRRRGLPHRAPARPARAADPRARRGLGDDAPGRASSPTPTTAASASATTRATSPATPTCSTSPGPTSSLDVHRAYLDAGADITTTNTFTATSIGQADYGLEDAVYDMNVEGARLARAGLRRARRRAALRRRVDGPAQPDALALAARWTTPPTGRSPSTRCATRYAEQVRGLVDGGVDLLLIETIFDTLNAKAAIAAARDVLDERGLDLPLWISVTIVDLSGRTLSGPDAGGLLGLGRARAAADRRRQLLARRRASCARTSRSSPASPTAPRAATPTPACPTPSAATTRGPTRRARCSREFAESGLVNVVGGCCGTTPEHTRAIAAAVQRHPAAPRAGAPARSRASAGSSRSPSPGTRTSSWSASGRTSPARRASGA